MQQARLKWGKKVSRSFTGICASLILMITGSLFPFQKAFADCSHALALQSADSHSRKVWAKLNKIFLQYSDKYIPALRDSAANNSANEQDEEFFALFENLNSVEQWLSRTRDLQLKRLEHHNTAHPYIMLSEQDLIEPGFAFYNSSSKTWIIRKINEPVPPGFDLHPDLKLVPGKVLYPSIGNGVFPVLIHFFIHDVVGHFKSYTRHLEYAAAYKKLAGQLPELSSWAEAKQSGLASRITYFNEGFRLVDRHALEEQLDFLLVPSTSIRAEKIEDIHFEDLRDDIQSASTRDLLLLADSLEWLGRHVELPIGGVVSEVNSQLIGHPYFSDILAADRDAQGGEGPETIEKIENLKIKILSYQRYLIALSQISPRDWADTVLSNDPGDLENLLSSSLTTELTPGDLVYERASSPLNVFFELNRDKFY